MSPSTCRRPAVEQTRPERHACETWVSRLIAEGGAACAYALLEAGSVGAIVVDDRGGRPAGGIPPLPSTRPGLTTLSIGPYAGEVMALWGPGDTLVMYVDEMLE